MRRAEKAKAVAEKTAAARANASVATATSKAVSRVAAQKAEAVEKGREGRGCSRGEGCDCSRR